MSEKTIKEQIKEAEDELLDLQINKAQKTVKRIQKRESVRDACGRIVKQKVTDARGIPLNRTTDDEEYGQGITED